MYVIHANLYKSIYLYHSLYLFYLSYLIFMHLTTFHEFLKIIKEYLFYLKVFQVYCILENFSLGLIIQFFFLIYIHQYFLIHILLLKFQNINLAIIDFVKIIRLEH